MSKYQARFTSVVSYIENNLDTDLDVNSLCQQVFLSKYHFHRQCSAFFGMSVISLARLLRLKRAAYQLAYRADERVIDIALANGYASHEAFSRAFKKHFAQSPLQFRKMPDWAPWQNQYEPVLKLREKIMKNVDFNVEVVDFPGVTTAVKEHRGAPNLLGKSIRQFIEWRKTNRLPPSKNRTFNVLYDDPNVTAAENYRFDLCCAVEHDIAANEHGVVNGLIPAGKCAVIRHVGSDDTIGMVVSYLYREWLIEAGYELRDFPLFFERVCFFPEVSESEMITDIYLPIE